MPFLRGVQKQTRKFFDTSDNMMYEWGPWWVSTKDAIENEWGDALWRTSLSYIAYPEEKDIKKGILSCFKKEYKKGKEFYQSYRAPNKGKETVSRDQIIMALCALKINGDKELKDISNGLRFRISNKYKMSFGMWAWNKWIGTDKKSYLYLCYFFFFFQFISMFTWNGIIGNIIGKNYASSLYNDMMFYMRFGSLRIIPKWKKWLNKTMVPSYGIHLAAWQLFVLPEGFIKKFLSVFIIPIVDKNNLLIRAMFKKDVSNIEIDNYIPMNDFRWQRNLNDGFWNGSPFFLNEKESEFNALDVDVLNRVIEINLNHQKSQ